MNGNAAMVELMPDNTPEDALYDFERAMRLEERSEDMLETLKSLLAVVGQPVTAQTVGRHVHMKLCLDSVSHLLRRSRGIVQNIEMGDPL